MVRAPVAGVCCSGSEASLNVYGYKLPSVASSGVCYSSVVLRDDGVAENVLARSPTCRACISPLFGREGGGLSSHLKVVC